MSVDNLLIAQNGLCFYCHQPLGHKPATIEHLCPKSKGGESHPHNLAVCCDKMNAWFADMGLFEKISVVMNHQGKLTCPYDLEPNNTKKNPIQKEGELVTLDRVLRTIKRLPCKRRPNREKALRNMIATHYQLNKATAIHIVKSLQKQGAICVKLQQVVYTDCVSSCTSKKKKANAPKKSNT